MAEEKKKEDLKLGYTFPCKVNYEVWHARELVEKDSWKAMLPKLDWTCNVQRAYDQVLEMLDKRYSRSKDPSFWFRIEAKLMWTSACPMAKTKSEK